MSNLQRIDELVTEIVDLKETIAQLNNKIVCNQYEIHTDRSSIKKLKFSGKRLQDRVNFLEKEKIQIALKHEAQIKKLEGNIRLTNLFEKDIEPLANNRRCTAFLKTIAYYFDLNKVYFEFVGVLNQRYKYEPEFLSTFNDKDQNIQSNILKTFLSGLKERIYNDDVPESNMEVVPDKYSNPDPFISSD